MTDEATEPKAATSAAQGPDAPSMPFVWPLPMASLLMFLGASDECPSDKLQEFCNQISRGDRAAACDIAEAEARKAAESLKRGVERLRVFLLASQTNS